MDIMTIISDLGFPVACVIACGWFILKLWQNQMEDKEKLYDELAKARETTNQAIETIKIYADKLDNIQSDIIDIKTKVETL